MKKVLFILATVIALVSCSSDDEQPKLVKSQIVGNWTLDYMWENNNWKFIGLINWRLILKDDFTYTSHQTKDYSGVWEIDGYNIICKSGDVTIKYKVDSISGNNAIVEMSYPPATEYLKFKVSR